MRPLTVQGAFLNGRPPDQGKGITFRFHYANTGTATRFMFVCLSLGCNAHTVPLV